MAEKRPMLRNIVIRAGIALLLGGSTAALAAPARIQSAAEALAQDAAEYAQHNGVGLQEAMARLRAQEESVATTDRIREAYRDRLAGISIEHQPEYRIVVLLTGSEPVPDQSVFAGGMNVPILFRTGAAATEDQIVSAMREHQAAIRSALPSGHGMGLDQRTGELVMMVRSRDADRFGLEEIDSRLEALTDVPVRVRVVDRPDGDLSLSGGARVEGIDPANGRRYSCTTGFVVTDGTRTGVVTAAHCPDSVIYLEPGGVPAPLDFVGQWGARYQDVQVHVGETAQRPLFFADTPKTAARPVTSWRNRASTRAGDAVCRRGETSGYSCSQVELTHYAPPGDLCGGPCDPTWVTVAGPSCRNGDSGGPIFNGTIAFGIVKGGNYGRGGTCNFYYYMSTDFLPDGWSLLYGSAS